MTGLINWKRKGFPPSISFSMSTFLAMIVLVSGTLLVGVNGRLDPLLEQAVLERFQLVEDILKYPYFKYCFDDVIDKMIGKLPKYGEQDNESPYFQLQYAYHSTPPATQNWPELYILMPQRRVFIIETRELQKLWEDINDYGNKTHGGTRLKCEEALVNAAIATDQDAEDKATAKIKECINAKVIQQINTFTPKDLVETVYRTCYKTVKLVMDAMEETTYPTSFRYSSDPWWGWNLFDQMYDETLEFDLQIHERITNTFPAFIQKLRDEGKIDESDAMQETLKNITDRLGKDPYYYIYFDGDADAIEYSRYFSGDGVEKFTEKMNEILLGQPSFAKNSFVKYVHDWDKKLDSFKDALDDDTFDNYVKLLSYYYDFFLRVTRRHPTDRLDDKYDENDVLNSDGLWDWDYTYYSIHNMRLAWDLLGAVLEELKCYMRDTYYFDLRPEALRRTQRNLTEGALFSGISRTMQAPCRIIDDLDLVGPYCTRENNEICAPVTPIRDDQRTDSIHHGGVGLLKPRWIYKYDPLKFTCGKDKQGGKNRGRKDWVMRVNTCRCGFRLDCGEDLGANITCQLQYSDLLRGQCRGSVAYPCKTLPLAPGKHNETCLSGYCNMKKNSCEDRPFLRRPFGGAVRPEMKMNVAILVGLMVYFVGFIYCQFIF